MKKICLAGFWITSYCFGVAGILSFYYLKHLPFLPFAFIAASYFTPSIAGKVLGLSPELQEQAKGKIPRFVEILWTITSIFVISLLVLDSMHIKTIGGFNIPFAGIQAVIIFYVSAAIRDIFLIRFYLRQDF